MKKTELFSSVFSTDFGGLLIDVPLWVQKSVSRKMKSGKMTLVSAVCPDYARTGSSLSYNSIGDGVPFNVEQHLSVVEELQKGFTEAGIQLEYHLSLADTEFDLPLVVGHMTGGDAAEFTRRCQTSVDRIRERAEAKSIPLLSAHRFLESFPNWFQYYGKAVDYLKKEVEVNLSTRTDMEMSASARRNLYRAMTGYHPLVNLDYCKEMVIRQWAQYMVWGKCAEEFYGTGFVLMNHSTPNLTRINDEFFHEGRERIPILRLSMTTMPGEIPEC